MTSKNVKSTATVERLGLRARRYESARLFGTNDDVVEQGVSPEAHRRAATGTRTSARRAQVRTRPAAAPRRLHPRAPAPWQDPQGEGGRPRFRVRC
jgi:hypothetical protein